MDTDPHGDPRTLRKDLAIALQYGRHGWIVEADIKGFFDNIDHQWMLRMLEERINDDRFADDFVCAFQFQSDAIALYQELGARLGKFGLEVAPDKTRILRFCRFDLKGSGRFDFLGFEYYWERTCRGRLGVNAVVTIGPASKPCWTSLASPGLE